MKKGTAFYISAVAAVLGAIGVALAAYSSMISTDNALANMPLVIGAGVVGVVLVVAAMLAPASMGNHNPVTALGVLAAIALFSYVYGQCLLQRIMLIAGLFSYNAGNTVGWNIFYVGGGLRAADCQQFLQQRQGAAVNLAPLAKLCKPARCTNFP